MHLLYLLPHFLFFSSFDSIEQTDPDNVGKPVGDNAIINLSDQRMGSPVTGRSG
jgi:hypothetical protein